MKEFGWGLDPTSQRVALEVLRTGPVSRAVLARRLGLSSATLTRLVRPLITQGLVVEGPARPGSSSGRPALPLQVVPQAASFLGVLVDRDEVVVARCDLTGTLLDCTSEPLSSTQPQQVAAAVARLARVRPRGAGPLAGVGITTRAVAAAPGATDTFDPDRWLGRQLVTDIEDALGVPVVGGSHVHALAAHEHWFGVGRGLSDLTTIVIGRGVATAITANDDLVTGTAGRAGRVGDLVTSTGAPLWQELSEPVLLKAAGELLHRDAGPDDLNDPGVDLTPVGGLLDRAANRLGRLVGLCALLVAPEMVVVCGMLTPALQRHRGALHQGIGAVLGSDEGTPPIEFCPAGPREVAQAAATLVIQDRMKGKV